MDQKGFANIILVVVIVMLVGAVGYFAFVRKSEPIAQQQTPTPIPKDETASWKTFNSKFKYKLKYPANFQIGFHGVETTRAEDASWVSITKSQPYSCCLNIESYPPPDQLTWGPHPDLVSLLKLDLESYANKIWTVNKNDVSVKKQIGALEKTTISNRPAYKFTLVGSFNDAFGGGYVLDEQYLYIITSNPQNSYKYLIRFPAFNQEMNQILSTFEFMN